MMLEDQRPEFICDVQICQKIRGMGCVIGRARVRPDKIAMREIRGYRVEYHNINAICLLCRGFTH